MQLGRRRRDDSASETWQFRLYLKLLVIAAALAYLVAFVVENHRATTVHFVFGTTHVSLIWLILLSLALGIAAGLLLSQLHRRRRQRRHERGEPGDAVPDLVHGDEAVGEPEGAAPTA